MKQHKTTRTALALSAFLFVFWILLGTNATLAWFSDTTQTAKNTFIIGDLNLDVEYKNGFVTAWMPMTEDSKVFNENALYEPGFTQVVWLKIENKGNVDFNYKVAVDVNSYTTSVNRYGAEFCLPPYLRFGILFGPSEIELERKLAQSRADQSMGDYTFNTYSKADDGAVVRANETRYAAVVVYMPESVGNEANYQKGYKVPQVDLGMTVFAQQAGTPLN
ncbi:MAG: hypothetical protein E7440_07955 [Ruminococcaceae bacterium]|nr:hypothetical protein [Oscillospiraceae bacterium]